MVHCIEAGNSWRPLTGQIKSSEKTGSCDAHDTLQRGGKQGVMTVTCNDTSWVVTGKQSSKPKKKPTTTTTTIFVVPYLPFLNDFMIV